MANVAEELGAAAGSAANASPLGSILKIGGTLIDRLIPDKTAQTQAKAELITMQLKGELDQAAAELQADVAQQAQINETMRAESASTHWLQWAWRPIVGLTLAAVIVNDYVLLPYLQGFGVKVIDIPDKVWEVMLAVCGVSALSRGVEKIVAQLPSSGKS